MHHPHKLLLQKFLEGSCSEAELIQAKELLKQPDIDKLLDEIVSDQTAGENNQRFVMDAYMIRRIELKRSEAQQRIMSTAYVDRKKNSPKNAFLINHSWLQEVEEIAIGIICGKIILECNYLNENFHTLSI
ncbi:hypothetical protein [Gynurincola endophyticus]|uniref:hypothetical protein n=1 Tax=Gynurincola endophyticus TaxID=2479004 RepID=UPI000F8EA8ED|nr:hypothetical protein [Gynurincola endophyticus]